MPLRLRTLSPLFLSSCLAIACNSTVDLGANVDGGSDAGGKDASDAAPQTPATCQGVCDKLQACGYVAPSKMSQCLSECRDVARPEDLACAARTDCDAIPKTCGDPTKDGGTDAASAFDVGVCQHGCDLAHDFDCMNAADHALCRSLCETSAKRSTYGACANGSGSNCKKHQDCWNEFKK